MDLTLVTNLFSFRERNVIPSHCTTESTPRSVQYYISFRVCWYCKSKYFIVYHKSRWHICLKWNKHTIYSWLSHNYKKQIKIRRKYKIKQKFSTIISIHIANVCCNSLCNSTTTSHWCYQTKLFTWCYHTWKIFISTIYISYIIYI